MFRSLISAIILLLVLSVSIANAQNSCAALFSRTKSLTKILPRGQTIEFRRGFSQKNLDRPAVERFDRQLGDLFAVLSLGNSETVAHELIKRGSRDTLYHLDALIRMYRETDLLDREARDLLGRSKVKLQMLSKILGDTNDANKYYKFAKKAGLPRSVQDALKLRRDKARADFETFLASKAWLEGKPQLLKKIGEVMSDLAEVKKKQDHREIGQAVADQLHDLLDSTLLEEYQLPRARTTPQVNRERFEEGPHEIRQLIRRVLASMNAAGDMFVLDFTPTAEYGGFQIDRSKPSVEKYLSGLLSPGPKSKRTVTVSADYVFALIDYVHRLGEAKDLVQAEDFLVWGLTTSGVATGPAAEVMAREIAAKHRKFENPFRQAFYVIKDIQEKQVLEKLVRQIESQL
ncbi:MAG: hypothetical protein ABL958_08560 [Bdellovibrionia bacterium]